jgi:hypothetical protein
MGDEALLHHHVEGEALECQVEQDGLVLQVVELLPRDLRTGLEVHQREALPDLEVVLGLEVEARRLAHPTQLVEVLLAAGGNRRVHQVGQRSDRPGQRLLGLAQAGVEGRDLLLQAPTQGDVGLALLGRELLFARRLVGVAALVQLVERGRERGGFALGGDRGVEIDAVDSASSTALADLVLVLGEGSGVQHGARGKHTGPGRATW